MSEVTQPENIVLVMDWSNISRAALAMNYGPREYDKEAGFMRIKQWLCSIARITRMEIYAPMHDLHAHFEFLRDQRFTVILCTVSYPSLYSTKITDTTDEKLIEDTLDLIDNYNMQYLCIGSGDAHFKIIAEKAKEKGIKVAIMYGSEVSLSPEMRNAADPYPPDHELAGQPMLHFFSPTKTCSE